MLAYIEHGPTMTRDPVDSDDIFATHPVEVLTRHRHGDAVRAELLDRVAQPLAVEVALRDLPPLAFDRGLGRRGGPAKRRLPIRRRNLPHRGEQPKVDLVAVELRRRVLPLVGA